MTYQGVNRHGESAGGSVPKDMTAAEFVEREFRRGWQFMRVVRDGEQVGGIYSWHVRGKRKRTWFGES